MIKSDHKICKLICLILVLGSINKSLAELPQSSESDLELLPPVSISITDCSSIDSENIYITYSSVTNATAYEIWRSDNNDIGNAHLSGSTHNVFYHDTDCIYEKVYFYWIRAVNLDLNETGPFSEIVRGCRPMPSVTNVRAEDGTDCEKVVVNFSPIPDDAWHHIEYKLLVQDLSKQAQTHDNYFSNFDVISGQALYYRIQAYNEYGSSISAPDPGWKKICSVQNLKTFGNYIPGAVLLTWDPLNDASGYNILRGMTHADEAEIIGTTSSSEYIDYSADKNYRYWIQAYNEYTQSISQEYVTGAPQYCEYRLDPFLLQIDENGGRVAVNMLTNFKSCQWLATSESSWITLEDSAGIGDGKFFVNVCPTKQDRKGYIIIEGEKTSPFNYLELLVKQFMTYTLSINMTGQGKIKINDTLQALPFENRFVSNTELFIQAIPKSSHDSCFFFTFGSWKETKQTQSGINLVMNQNFSLTAEFIEKLTLNLTIEDAGIVKVNDMVIRNDTTFNFKVNDSISLLAIPDNKSQFVGWMLDNNESIFQSPVIELSLSQCYSVKAVFDSGWQMDITSRRDNSEATVTIGIKAKEFFLNMQTLPSEYLTHIFINRYFEADNVTKGSIDIRQKIGDPYYENYYWGLSINPHGNIGPPIPQTSIISWDGEQIDDDYSCQLIEGFDGKGQIIIDDMKSQNQLQLTGLNETNNFTVRCRKIPERPAIIIEGEKNQGIFAMSVVLDTGPMPKSTLSPPQPPDFSCDLYIITDEDVKDSVSVNYKRKNLKIFEQGHDSYSWFIACNPHGNIGAPYDTSVRMRWHLNNFNEGEIGFWKLIEGNVASGKVLIDNMNQIPELIISGGNEYFFYTVQWSKFWELSLIEGWNLISIPLEMDDMSVSSLFPDAEVAYSFENGAYQMVDHITPCNGYWIKNLLNKTYRFSGIPILQYSKNLDAGWHLIGGMLDRFEPVTSSGNVICYLFSYSQGHYEQTNSICQGNGYWIKLNRPATIKNGLLIK
jgi:hypothetical protein